MNNKATGKVIFAGAGPGDPDLITVKAARCLQEADVVLTDRLVSEAILHRYVNSRAEIVRVGKQGHRAGSTPQGSINELLVMHALDGKQVVRLKGGDVSVFSNIFDELDALVQHRIPYEIIPGVTAALGAAAYAGIPLTARGFSTGVRLLTFYKSNIIQGPYWKELAQTQDTLVFYMSADMLADAVKLLLENGTAANRSLAVIEQATTPMQQVTVCTLQECVNSLHGKTFLSPSLIIIGKVAELYSRFRWLKNSTGQESYFKPVYEALMAAGKSIHV